MKLKVSIYNYSPEKKIKALARITFDEVFTVAGIKVMEGKNGQLSVFMPQQEYTDRNGTKHYTDIAHPITAEARNIINSHVLKSYMNHVERENAAGRTGKAAVELKPQLGQDLNYTPWNDPAERVTAEEPELEME